MPPVTSSGSAAPTAPRSTEPARSAPQSASQPHSAAPAAAPISGKKHMAYFRFASDHSACGTGMRE